MAKSIASETLSKLIAALPPRQKATATGHMRERIAVALRGSRPSFFMHGPEEAYTLFLYDTPEMRQWYEQWADDFLRHCDALDLQVTDSREALEK
jgi:hypothetical protein